MHRNRFLITALAIPIFSLVGITAYRRYNFSHGTEVSLPISGFDPRDLLSGHFLIYQIDYGVDETCGQSSEQREAYICLEPRLFSWTIPSECQLFIKGWCRYSRFEAGIEKYFVPENRAQDLETMIRSGKGSVVLSVMRSGTAQVKELLIDGHPWSQSE